MGVLPLTFKTQTLAALKLDGSETFDLVGLPALAPRTELLLRVHRADGAVEEVKVEARIDTQEELAAFRHGGLLPQVYREFTARV